MILLLEIVLWFSLGAQLYPYLGYPLVLWIGTLFFTRPIRLAPVTPTVSLIIAAYNEERVIAQKLGNTLALDYPALETIVSTEGSTDATAAVASGFSAIKVINGTVRRGKGHAINSAVAQSTGEIIVLSDANALYRSDAIRQLVMPFADPEVGCVTGRKTVADTKLVGTGESFYWDYEGMIRTLEGHIGSSTGVNGEMLAIRREIFVPIPERVINDDLFLALQTIRANRRVAFRSQAVCEELPSLNMHEDAARRARIVAGRCQLFFDMNLLPWRRPLEFFMLFSHKVLRLVLPVFMILGYAANVLLVALAPHRTVPMLLFLGQTGLLALALFGAASDRLRLPWRPARVLWYFLASQLASGIGLLRYLRQGQTQLWTRARRQEH
jgi:cellulose synthase/poly-beta-1,6-N-acetylglucosamine synthase-like glycosyltransferase